MDWRHAIETCGFATLPGLFSSDYLDHLLKEIEVLSPKQTRAGLRHALRLGPVARITRDPRLAEPACSVLGKNAFPFRATLFDKSVTANWLVVWHQDTALPLRERIELAGWGPWSVKEGVHYAHAPAGPLSQVLALRIHFDDSTPDNGPLRVLPGTHKLGVLSDDDVHELAEGSAPIDCCVPKGGVLGMRPLLVHASSKSRVDLPRRVLHIEYAASDSIAAPLQLTVC